MTINDVSRILNADIVLEASDADSIDIHTVCGSDLMSDVMAYVTDNVMLLTGLVTPQVIRTAEMMDIHTVVFVRGKKPNEAMIDLAKERNISLLATESTMFTACGLLYSAGLKGKR